MGFESRHQERVYGLVANWLAEMSAEMSAEDELSVGAFPDKPMFLVDWGGGPDTFVAVLPIEEADDAIEIRVYSLVVKGPNVTPELMSFLLEANVDGLISKIPSALGIDSDGDVVIRGSLLGTTDKDNFQSLVTGTLTLALLYAEVIVAQWGGERQYS